MRQTKCQGLDKVALEDCSLSSAAKAAFQSTRTGRRQFDIDENEIREAIADTLRRFRGGHNGFRTRLTENIDRSVLASISFGKELLEALKEKGVIANLRSGGTAIYKVSKTADARIFLENGIAVGCIKETADALKRDLVRE